ncbi:MAG: sulfatase-like hydrolase/transferase, partial [Kiritimatiellales bacterium]|nr:sulfatase-like hydrolase/transferase [Kiritimatiellales bacterium]
MMNVKIRVLWSVILAGIAVSAFSAQPKPNFLIILVDDMGYSDIEVYGGEVKTPNLKRLAEGGMKFTQMYNTSKCYPTRAALMTGVYFQRTDREFPNTATMGEVLRPAGYRTLWTGKHHAKFNPTTRGFDRHFGLLGGCCNYWNPGSAARPGEGAPAHKLQSRWSLDGKEVDDFIPEDKDFYTTDAFTDYALKWLEEYKKEVKPFLLYVPYNAPHWPLHA